MSTIAQKTQALYDKIAPSYNKSFPVHPHPEYLKLFIKSLPKNAKILDVGCAGGRDTDFFVKNGFRATGLDFSTGQIAYAKTKYPGVIFIQGDMLELLKYFSKNEFDAVFCYAALDHLQKADFPHAILNFNQILKNGGVLFLVTRRGKGVLWTKDNYSQNLKRRFTLIEDNILRDHLSKNGFEIDHFETFLSKTRKNMEFSVVLCKKLKIYSL